jgi:hypothetical protein
MKIAINFIGTGNYLKFFPKYYESFMEYFVPECEKDFFVFTDGELGDNIPENIKIIQVSEETDINQTDYNNWETITIKSMGGLKRFGQIQKIKNQLLTYDWYVYLDADMYCCPQKISYGEFFDDTKNFFAVQHPCQNLDMCKFTTLTREDLPFERNKESLSYVGYEEQEDDIYVQGCLWGGKIPKVFELIDTLSDRVIDDLNRNIIAMVRDESHLNKYRIEHINDFNILHPSFAKPGDYSPDQFTFESKIIHSPSDKKTVLNS